MAILAIAGETETGQVDPLNEIADIAEEHNISLVVDGAYGAPFRNSREKDRFKGMERAMAITIDPHKALYTPYNNGAVLFRNVEDHARLNAGVGADYLQFERSYPALVRKFQNNEVSLGEKRIEGSMSAGPILSTLAVINSLGVEGLATLYDLSFDRTAYLYTRILKSRYLKPLHEPDLNLLCFTLKEEIQKRLKIKNNRQLQPFIASTREELDKSSIGEGGYFFSETNLPKDSGKKEWVYRTCILHPRTTDEIIEKAVSRLEQIIKERLRKVPRP